MSDRVCKTCGDLKPLDSFTKHKASKGGHLSHCKPCLALKSKLYKAQNPEKWRAIDRESKKKSYDSTKQCALKKELYRNDPLKFKTKNKNYYQKNKESVLNRVLSYRKSNLDRYRLLGAERRSRKRTATPRWITPALRQEMLSVYLMARRLTQVTQIKHEVDHIVPLQHPKVCGLHVPWNLQILTKTNNASKSNLYWPDMW